MKRIICLITCMLLMCSSALAQVLPDAGKLLNVRLQQEMKDYVFSSNYICDVWVYPRDVRTDERMADWIMAALESGYTVSVATVQGQSAYRLEDANGLYALMFPQYQGAVMLMVQQGMDYAPAIATPTPKPTAQPTPLPEMPSTSSGEWVWVEVEKDCPSCVNGTCSICKGTGVYRLYGEEIPCDRDCSSCDGRGTYISYDYQYVKTN